MKNRKQDQITALSLTDEAFHTVRDLPVAVLIPYFAGTLPFILGLLYFWNDMSKNAFAAEYCLNASLGLAALFAWMKFWQAVFCQKVYALISSQDLEGGSLFSGIQLLMTQTVFHTTAIFVLPAAALITIPFAWMVAMYQMGLVCDEQRGSGIKKIFRDNYTIARHFTLLNHLMAGLFFVFSIFVFLNITAVLFMAPYLLKALFGVQAVWTMGGYTVLNSTFILSACSLTYLCLDPVVKTAYVLEKFYFQDLKTGTKILADLEKIKRPPPQKGLLITVAAVLMLLVSFPPNLQAGTGSAALEREPAVAPSALEASIQKVISQREYAWRLPKTETDQALKKEGFIYNAVQWCLSGIKRIGRTIGSWIETFFNWLEKLFPEKDLPQTPKDSKSRIEPEYLALGLLVLVVVLVLMMLNQLKKLKRDPEQIGSLADEAVPDVANENVTADRLPSEKWISLAFELMEKGDVRTAIRALFLATLALLSENGLLRIAKHKSNKEYESELFRRAHSRPELLENFSFTVKTVDRVWYGMHDADRALFERVVQSQKRIFSHAR